MFETIPTTRPETPLLDTINGPEDLRKLSDDQLPQLATELRGFLLYSVGQTGGHFGAGLGVVELTIALHAVFQTPFDRLIWDVGHQTYPHKILTGRREAMATLRQPNGLAPFPSRSESPFDVFGTGHSSTSISAALGMELASRNLIDSDGTEAPDTVVVIGDGAMTAGMAFEALNHVAAAQANILIVLNDNAMSISENVGGLANYFARNISAYKENKSAIVTDDAESQAGGIFTDLGFDYSGPIDGHDLGELTRTLASLKSKKGPRLLHVATRKGKGYAPAEAAPVSSHSLTKLEKQTDQPGPSYSAVFGDWVCDMAAEDHRLMAITPAMRDGSGLNQFAARYPTRFHDVAIAEQHAVTLAAGMAAAGAKPVVAIYSTFLQRAFDQLVHDVAIQDLDVLFAVDRASLLEDGPTHSGVFDLTFSRAIPGLVVMAPSNAALLEMMLTFGYAHTGPCLVRYPRGEAAPASSEEPAIELGKANVIRQGAKVALLSFGTMRAEGEQVADSNNYTLIDMRFVKPLDAACIEETARTHDLMVTLEENVIAGGAGSAVNELVATMQLNTPVLNLGIGDEFVIQDEPTAMRESQGLSVPGIEKAIAERL